MRHRRLTGVAGLALVAGLVSGGGALAKSPAGPGGPTPAWAYAVVRDATAATPLAGKDRGNSAGGSVTVTRLGTGRYQAEFGGVGASGGVVLVDALNTRQRICRVDEWFAALTTEVARVTCFRRSGQRSDTPFVIHWLAMSGTSTSPAVAYLWANDATATDYAPSAQWAYTMTGGAISIHRAGTGLYRVRLEDMGFIGGQVHVSAYGARTSCNAVRWGVIDDPIGQDEESITVRCRDFSGNATDSQFTLAFWNNQGPKGLGTPVAYARATRPRVANYVPGAIHQYSSPGVQWRIVRRARGVYAVAIENAPLGGLALVTMTGDKPVSCQLASIAKSGTIQKVGVRCFEFDGSTADAPFVITHTR